MKIRGKSRPVPCFTLNVVLVQRDFFFCYMKCAMMKMFSNLVTDSESLKIGKRQKYKYITDTYYIS